MVATAAALFAAFWIGLGFLILWSDVRAHRRVGPLSTRPTAIQSLEDGHCAKLVGKLRLGEQTVSAPLSGRTCAAYQVETARRRRMRWRQVDVQAKQAGFYVDDGTGEVFVPGEVPVTLHLEVDGRYRGGRKRAAAALSRWLAPHREEDPRAALRCDEATLPDGVKVAVFGRVRKRPSSSGNGPDERAYRERPFEFVVEPADDAVHISDMRTALG